MKPGVVIIGTADWAGSAYNASRAINCAGEFACRAITCYQHPHEFDVDILLPLFPLGQMASTDFLFKSINSANYDLACQVIEDAEVLHFWNVHPAQIEILSCGLPLNFKKVKALTWTGSTYRRNHKALNESSRHFDRWKVTVQNPCLKFPDEIDSTFIPHAINVDTFDPCEDKENTIATYRPLLNDEASRSPDKDISRIYEIVKRFPDWKVDLDYTMPHRERMQKLSRCSIFVQDLNSQIGYWGRSVLEASLLGLPCLQSYDSDLVLNLAGGRLGDSIPIVQSDRDNIEKDLTNLIQDPEERRCIGDSAREWVKEHYSYPVVGKLYSEFYKTL